MRTDFSREVHCVLGLPFDAVDLAGAERRVREAAKSGARCFLSTPNVNFVVGCRSDAAFRRSVVMSDLSVADGMPIVWLARLMGIPIRTRVAGSSLFEALRGGPEPLSVYFFGGPDGMAEEAWRRLGARCVGYAFPGYGSVDEMSGEEVIRHINESKADLLVVSLGARKGQEWIERNLERLRVPVVSHLGAVVAFAAGRVRRAPAWMQAVGLEWLWRIKEQPSLWRRYAGDGLMLLRLCATRVLPYVWHVRRRARQDLGSASLEASGATLGLAGPWTADNLARLRRALHHVALAGKDLRLDLSGVTFADSAFVGLLMLADGHQRGRGRRLVIAALSEPVRKVIHYCCAEYLLPGGPEAPEAAAEDEALAEEAA